jgi:hypothetical protein
MKIEVFDDADAVAREAAKFIAAEARAAVAAQGRRCLYASVTLTFQFPPAGFGRSRRW